jgi:hypothetical protein
MFNAIENCTGHVTNPDPLHPGTDIRGPDAAFLALGRLYRPRSGYRPAAANAEDVKLIRVWSTGQSAIDQVLDFYKVKKTYDYLGSCVVDVRCKPWNVVTRVKSFGSLIHENYSDT